MAIPNDAWPNRSVAATVVDTDPPPPSAWSGRAPTDSSHDAWPTKKKPLRAPRPLAQPTQPTKTTPAQSTRVGRWIVATALWALAGGLFAGRTVAAHVDRAVEVGMDWLTVRGPRFLRPYMPAPVPKMIEPRARRHVPASPADGTPSKEAAQAASKQDRGRRHR